MATHRTVPQVATRARASSDDVASDARCVVGAVGEGRAARVTRRVRCLVVKRRARATVAGRVVLGGADVARGVGPLVAARALAFRNAPGGVDAASVAVHRRRAHAGTRWIADVPRGACAAVKACVVHHGAVAARCAVPLPPADTAAATVHVACDKGRVPVAVAVDGALEVTIGSHALVQLGVANIAVRLVVNDGAHVAFGATPVVAAGADARAQAGALHVQRIAAAVNQFVARLDAVWVTIEARLALVAVRSAKRNGTRPTVTAGPRVAAVAPASTEGRARCTPGVAGAVGSHVTGTAALRIASEAVQAASAVLAGIEAFRTRTTICAGPLIAALTDAASGDEAADGHSIVGAVGGERADAAAAGVSVVARDTRGALRVGVVCWRAIATIAPAVATRTRTVAARGFGAADSRRPIGAIRLVGARQGAVRVATVPGNAGTTPGGGNLDILRAFVAQRAEPQVGALAQATHGRIAGHRGRVAAAVGVDVAEQHAVWVATVPGGAAAAIVLAVVLGVARGTRRAVPLVDAKAGASRRAVPVDVRRMAVAIRLVAVVVGAGGIGAQIASVVVAVGTVLRHVELRGTVLALSTAPLVAACAHTAGARDRHCRRMTATVVIDGAIGLRCASCTENSKAEQTDPRGRHRSFFDLRSSFVRNRENWKLRSSKAYH